MRALKTTPETILALIRENKTNPKIRSIAIGILRANNISGTDYPNAIKAVANWVHKRMKFVRDPYKTDIMYPPLENIMQLGAGDCEDFTATTGSLLESLGIPVKVVVVSKTGKIWDHVFLRAGYPVDNPVHWVSVDTTVYPPSGREIPYVKQKIYNPGGKVSLGSPDGDLIDTLENMIAPDIENQVAEIYHPYEVSWLQDYATELGRITGRSMNYRAYAVPGDTINAFSIPGGSMYVYKGLIDKFDKAVVCGVLGHEITHIARRHCINSYIGQYGIDLISNWLNAGKSKKMVTDILKLVALGYGREAEFEADRGSVDYNNKAGLYPFGIKHFLEWLVTVEKQPSLEILRKIQTLLASHPAAVDRLKNVNDEITKLGIKETTIPITEKTLVYAFPIVAGVIILLASLVKK